MPYSKQVINHFQNPKNFGKISNPSAIGKVGNPICGDLMHLYIKVEKNKQGEEFLADIKFQTFGCVAAISTSSAITEIAKGKTLKEAININSKQLVDSLGQLPPVKIHCSVLAADALHEAIYNYLKKTNQNIPEFLEKIHQRLEKERELIKEKFKDWVGLEEKQLKK
ncbi:MAG: iron-sulfur cluster assembly scaffold protein [Candidatus Shapirobacteria bacterium]|nr:iron-sulfur cluster assembly scaffold protein [Candidatus Shapirobacteria bacterium]